MALENDASRELQDAPSKKSALLIISAAVASTLAGFTATLLMARKLDPGDFTKGFHPVTVENSGKTMRLESGVRFAARAFGCASLLTFTAVGSASYLVWCWSGAKTMRDFNHRLSNLFPPSWRLTSSGDGTNFRTFSELWSYIQLQDRTRGHTYSIEEK